MAGTAKTSGLITASAAVPETNKRGVVSALIGYADGTNAAVIELFDGVDDSGELIAKVIIDPPGRMEAQPLNEPVRYTTGLYIKITGTGAQAIVHHGA